MKTLEIVHRLLDDTYRPASKAGTYSLKHVMHGEQVSLNYSTIVHFASERSLVPQAEAARDQARQLIKDRVSRLKKDFKEETDASLKYKDLGESDSIELVESTSNSPRKVAYYRYSQLLKITD